MHATLHQLHGLLLSQTSVKTIDKTYTLHFEKQFSNRMK